MFVVIKGYINEEMNLLQFLVPSRPFPQTFFHLSFIPSVYISSFLFKLWNACVDMYCV